jgi:hypothetical protein
MHFIITLHVYWMMSQSELLYKNRKITLFRALVYKHGQEHCGRTINRAENFSKISIRCQYANGKYNVRH